VTRLAGKNLLLAELIVVMLFFSLSAAACVMLFSEAYTDGEKSRDLTYAVILAQNTAEVFKASDGDTEKTAQLLGVFNTELIIYDENWEIVPAYYSTTTHDRFYLSLEAQEKDGLSIAEITVGSFAPNEILYNLTVAVAKGEQT